MVENIFLIGFMGTGKTTISTKLSKMIPFRKIDLDEEIEKKEGMEIKQIFETYGEAYFRDSEYKSLKEFEEKKGYIVSCGGGIVLRQDNIDSMKKSGKVVLLTAKPETIYERVRYEKNRPLLNGNMNIGYITELMRVREAYYQRAADFVIETDEKCAEAIAEEIVKKCNKKI